MTKTIAFRGPGAWFDRDSLGALAVWPARRDVVDKTLSGSLGRIGSLEVKLATTRAEVKKAQKLRFKVFYKEGGAIPDVTSSLLRRDLCAFDRICDHLIVIDHDHKSRFGRSKPKVVGAYRLLRQRVAEAHGGFYSASEFEVAPLLARHPDKNFLELGRSCVHRKWRDKRTLELLWRGLWTYVRHHSVDVMIGCASLPGTDIGRNRVALDFLMRHARADAEWLVEPAAGQRVSVGESAGAIDARKALSSLPPLLKGYLRVGAKVGDGAVVDAMFNTTDVFVVMPVKQLDQRYAEYFSNALAPN